MDINLTDFQNSTGLAHVGTMANNVTNGLFWGVLLISIFVIMLFKIMPKMETASAFAVASFICFSLSLFLVYLQWVSIFYAITFLLMVAGSLFVIKYGS